MLDGMRAELAVDDGWPPPHDLPDGEFYATTLGDGSIRIDRADPRILISAELLDLIRAACLIPCAPPSASDLAVHMRLDGDLLKINGVNQTVIYRIAEYVPRVRGYIAEWPD